MSEPTALSGDCTCGRGPTIGTLTWTSGRMHLRAFHDGPAEYHHEGAADQACLDCVTDTAVLVTSGEAAARMRETAARRGIPAGGQRE